MKIEEIRSALEDVSAETLADALSIILAEGKAPTQAVAGTDRPELANFAQAIMYLKKNYGFEELEYFTTEADLVYVNAGDRRILLTDRMNVMTGHEGGDRSSTDRSGSNVGTPGSHIQEDSGNDTPASGSNNGRFSNLEI